MARKTTKPRGTLDVADEETETTKTKPRGPSVYWTGARDRALIEAYTALSDENDLSLKSLVATLSEHEAFEGVGGQLTAQKVSHRMGYLRRKGVHLPKLRKTSRYVPVDELNTLLGDVAQDEQDDD